MAEDLDRDRIIGLLESLGSERDEDVVEVAREIHAQVTAAGVTWDVLLAPNAAAEDATFEEETADEDDKDDKDDEDAAEGVEESEDAAPAPVRDGGNKESLALIARLLAKSDISKDMREELQGYKEDIADGEFEEVDRKYLRALYARLGKRR